MLGPSSLLIHIHGVGSYSAHYYRRKISMNPTTNPLIYSGNQSASVHEMEFMADTVGGG